LKTYEHNAKCEKCGQGDISNRFVQKGKRLGDYDSLLPWTAEQDVIRRYCRNCGYEWVELPVAEAALAVLEAQGKESE
jgi:ssDNA-binding Zn-finger/Zn-ribbon topoisomerase 1